MNNPEQKKQYSVNDRQSPEEARDLATIYLGLIDLVQESIQSQEIDKTRIEHKITGIAGIFEKEIFNELLLYWYASSRNNYLTAHIANNVILSIGFASMLGLQRQEIHDVGYVAFGHDLSMMEYADLVKRSMQLTESDNQLIRRHPLKSAEIVEPYFPATVIQGILDVHECANGQGYPNRKTSGEISFLAKIVGICDVFEALTHPRNFRKEFSPYEALKMIIKNNDVIFDRGIVKKFVEFLSIYPIGSLVALNTGDTGIVVGSNPGSPTRAVVRVLLNARGEVVHAGKTVNLLNDHMLYISAPAGSNEEREILQSLKPRGNFNL